MRVLSMLLNVLFLLGGAAAAWAGPRLAMVRDAETEAFLRDLARPVFEQAGLSPDSVHFVLVQDRDVNAFVAGGMNIFLYTGLLQEAKTPEELVGVIAHETGHIAGGHLVRTDEAMRNASATAILGTLAGLAAAVGSGNGSAGAAAVSIGQQVAQRNFLQYSRTQESSADQAALRFLQGARISAQGMYDFLSRLQDQELLPEDQQVAFVRTHPLTRDRVEAIAAALTRAPAQPSLAVFYTERFARIRAKLEGFLDPRGTLQRQGAQATTFADRYARAVALHQTGDTQGALTLVTGLLREEPNNPYLHELQGQILYESGRVAESLAPYRQAVTLSDGNDLLRVGLAQALLNTDRPGDLADAVTQLETALNGERQSPLLWRLLATTYGRQNNLGMAAYALAEEALNRGDKPVARQQAKRAQELLPHGSPGWIKAGDVLTAAEQKEESLR